VCAGEVGKTRPKGWSSIDRLPTRLLRQTGGLPGYHLPLAAFIGVDVGEADAEAVRTPLRHDADAARSGQHDRVAQILRLDVGGLDRGVDRAPRLHVADQALLGVE